jgi:hypothetical protein
MLRKTLFHCTFLLVVSCLATSVNGQTAPASLSATEIVDRNVSARGGLQAWRAAQTMSYSGQLDAGGKQNVQLPQTPPDKSFQRLRKHRQGEHASMSAELSQDTNQDSYSRIIKKKNPSSYLSKLFTFYEFSRGHSYDKWHPNCEILFAAAT